MEVSNEQRSSDTLRLISFSCSHREVRWARMRLVKDWGCMISGTEYGTYRGPAHSVVRAYTMGSTGLRPLWSSCKSRVMQLQLLALPSNPVEGSVSFWAHNWTPFSLCISIWDMGWTWTSISQGPFSFVCTQHNFFQFSSQNVRCQCLNPF